MGNGRNYPRLEIEAPYVLVRMERGADLATAKDQDASCSSPFPY